MDKPDKYAVVARITGAHGIKGWVKVHSYTQPAGNVFSYKPWRVELDGRWQELEADSFRAQGKGTVAHLCGIDDRNEAEALSGLDICVLREQFNALEGGDHYWYQLQGLQVYSVDGDARVLLGEVSGFLETGANDVLVVKGTADSIDQKERLIPYVDQYLLKIDTDAGEILVDWDPEF
ncbi:MAG: ribosome maturation factor RimM [Candidatus Reddybacter sp.]